MDKTPEPRLRAARGLYRLIKAERSLRYRTKEIDTDAHIREGATPAAHNGD